MKMDVECVVIGAGVSGLSAARQLQEMGVRPTVLEKSTSAGGLTRSIHLDDFCFDYTGHLLHLSRYTSPSAIPFARLSDSEWQRIERKSACYVDGGLAAAPLQYNMGDLRDDLRNACIDSYEGRSAIPETATFRDYMHAAYGKELSDVFLIPLNEKTMAIPLDQLSDAAVRRFLPKPDEKLIRAGMDPDRESHPKEYNSTFWYPVTGGIEKLVHGMAAGLDHLQLHEEVVAVDLREHTLKTRSGITARWGSILTSMPLPSFCAITDSEELRQWGGQLTHSSTIAFNLGIAGALPEALRDLHWVYVADKSIPFYRVGFYSNISSGMCPSNCSAAYVEIGVNTEQLSDISIRNIYNTTLDALARMDWIDPGKIICCCANIIRCAYVHQTDVAQSLLPNILQTLRDSGVYPIGRYGLWDYTSMEDCVHAAAEQAKEMAS